MNMNGKVWRIAYVCTDTLVKHEYMCKDECIQETQPTVEHEQAFLDSINQSRYEIIPSTFIAVDTGKRI